MEKKYKRKALQLIMLSPLLATVLAKILFLLMAFTFVWESTTAMHIYIISFDVSIKICGGFILWEQMKKDKNNLQEEKQISEPSASC